MLSGHERSFSVFSLISHSNFNSSLRRIASGAFEWARKSVALLLVYATMAATMPVRANEVDNASQPRSTTISIVDKSILGNDSVKVSDGPGLPTSRPFIDQDKAGDKPTLTLSQSQVRSHASSSIVSHAAPATGQTRKKSHQMAQPLTTAPNCLYALDASAQAAFSISGSTSISTSCSVAVESSASQAFQMSGTETLDLQNNAQVGVVGGWNLSGQTKIVNQSTGQSVSPVKISSPGDPLSFLPIPSGGTIIGKTHTSYDMNNKPPNNTLSAGIYCGGLTIGNTNGATFTMSPGTYIMAGGGLTINSLAVVSGSGVTVYNTSSTGWGCSGSSSYTPITISGQANVTISAPSTGALANVLLFGDARMFQSGELRRSDQWRLIDRLQWSLVLQD